MEAADSVVEKRIRTIGSPGGGRSEARTLLTATDKRCLGGGYGDAIEGATYVREQSGQIIPERLCTDRDGKGDENNKHRVFGSCGTAFVTAKASGQSEHLTFLLHEDWPVASGRQKRSQSLLSDART